MAVKRIGAPSVAAGAVIIDSRDRVLLIKSPQWNYEYMIPGGHVDAGERILDAAAREAKEEVGLEVRPVGVLAVAEDIHPKEHVGAKHYVYFDVLCRPKDDKVTADNLEVIGYAWVNVKRAIKLVQHPVIKRALKEYLRQSKKGKFDFINIRRD